MSRKCDKIKELRPGDAVCVGARVAVRTRLRGVRRWAGEAARTKGRDERAVHQLRVSCRKASAALEAYEACFDPKQFRRMRRLVKRLRRGAGAARDLDVQAALWRRLREESPAAGVGCRFMLARGKVALRAARKDLRSTLRRVDDSSIADRSRKLLRGVHAPDPAVPGHACLGAFAIGTVGEMVDGLLVSSSETDAVGLHEARIAEKRAQYALELFRGVLDERAAAALRHDLRVLHDGLGEYHDLVCAESLLESVALMPESPGLAIEVLRGEVARRMDVSGRRARAMLNGFAALWGGGVDRLRVA